MKMTSRFLMAVALVATFGSINFVSAQPQDPGPPEVFKISHGMNPHEVGGATPTGGTGTVTPAITHHGGPVMGGTVAIYYIFYGNWNQSNGSDNAAGKQILVDFANGIGGSPYFNLNTTYSISGTTVTGNVSYGGSVSDAYSQGSRLRDSSILTIVNRALSNGLPWNANGVYFVLTSSDVSEQSGFCTRYCGWHTAATSGGRRIRYSFVGNANRCLSSCAAQTTGPNGNAGVDGMISVVAHELEEAVSDPDLNAWYDSQGAENADKCAWTFGHAQQQAANGAWYNMTLGSRKFLIQRNLQHNSSGDLCKVNANQN